MSDIKAVDIENRVNPELRSTLDAMKKWDITSMDEIPKVRRMLLERAAKLPKPAADEDVFIEDKLISGISGFSEVHVRIYTPKKAENLMPGVLFFRGSGFIIGKIEQFDVLCSYYCKHTNCVFVSVDYRLAPEHPYPAAIEDCYAALEWTAANCGELRIDTARLAVMGVSAGGGLAVSTALMARDFYGPKISLLVPLYPMLDCRNNARSNREIIDARLWDGEKNGWGWNAYLNTTTGEAEAYASPANADTYKGLPAVVTFIGELDALRDETFFFVQRLIKDEVPVEFHLYPGCFHSFETGAPMAGVSRAAKEAIVNAISRAFHNEDIKNFE